MCINAYISKSKDNFYMDISNLRSLQLAIVAHEPLPQEKLSLTTLQSSLLGMVTSSLLSLETGHVNRAHLWHYRKV